jgi:hypothetical protein
MLEGQNEQVPAYSMTFGSILMMSVPHSFKAVLNLAAVLSLGNTSGLAANISLSPLDNDPAHARVAVDGRFEAGDEIKFRTEVGRLTKAVVVFNSDGGILQAGIEIGKTIRLKSFATAVLDGSRCASSCAFAWLGGSPRFMQRGAQIGFHAAYISREGRPSESGVGNALVGSYLTQIGLPETAVVYVTKAAPTQLTFLTLQDAQGIGIEVLPFEQYAPTTKPAQRITPRGHQELTLECGAAKSTPPDNDPDPIYKTKIAVTDQVIYVEHYAASGKTFSRNEQYRDQRFWPQEKTNNWSGVSVNRPDRTMVGSIRMDKGGQRVEYTEKVYRSGKLEVTIVSVCRRIPGPDKTEPPVTFEQHAPTTKQQVQVIEDLQLREQPDPRARNILGAPPDDRMPKGSQVAVIDTCQTWMGSGRGAQDADNIWCPVLYEGHRGWANAYFLANDHGKRVACVMYPTARGCASTAGR